MVSGRVPKATNTFKAPMVSFGGHLSDSCRHSRAEARGRIDAVPIALEPGFSALQSFFYGGGGVVSNERPCPVDRCEETVLGVPSAPLGKLDSSGVSSQFVDHVGEVYDPSFLPGS